jgi:release factor glutamine methyltransferase
LNARPSTVLRRAEGYLARHGVASPLPEAEALLAATLGTDRSGLYKREEPLSPKEAKEFGRALCRRCSGVPLQHVTGEQGFRKLIVAVRPGVFVPRPETEVTAQAAIDAIDGSGLSAPALVDVGTGTGAIALAVKQERPGARVFATDISPEAAALARSNTEALGLDVEVCAGDLFDGLPARLKGEVDVVVSNPPYVELDADDLPADVRADPAIALYGDVGTYARLFDAASPWMRPGGSIVVEVAEDRAAQVSAAATAAGFTAVEVIRDLNGRDRVVRARRLAAGEAP